MKMYIYSFSADLVKTTITSGGSALLLKRFSRIFLNSFDRVI